MTTESTGLNKPQALDDLVPLVGDIIDHALKLQRDTGEVVEKFRSAADDVSKVTDKLSKTQESLTRSITQEVGAKFDDAINGAAARISAQLVKAEKNSTVALARLDTAVNEAVEKIHAEGNNLHARVRLHLLFGSAGGLAIGILGTIAFFYFRSR